MSSCHAGKAISTLGGGRDHGRGLSGQLERQQAREGLFPAQNGLSSFGSAGREAVEGEGLFCQSMEAGTQDSATASSVRGPTWPWYTHKVHAILTFSTRPCYRKGAEALG